MAAKEICVIDEKGGDLTVHAFGMEENGAQARWGPGIRNRVIIHFVIRGKGYFNGTGIRANQGFVMYPNRVYEYHADEKEPWNYFWIILTGKRVASFLEEYGIPKNAETFRFCFSNNFEQSFKDIFDPPEPTASHTFVTGLLYMMLSFVQKDTANAQANRAKAHVDNAMEFIHNNYHQKIKVADIADRLFLDPGYLYNLFMRYAEVSPKEYLNTVRINKACELLSQTSLQVSEISCSVGYDDPLQFSKFFKSRLGISPLDYRRRAALQAAKTE